MTAGASAQNMLDGAVRASLAFRILPQTSVQPTVQRGDVEQRTRALIARHNGLTQTLAIYNDPTDYRRAGWLAEVAALDERLARIAAALEQLAAEFES